MTRFQLLKNYSQLSQTRIDVDHFSPQRETGKSVLALLAASQVDKCDARGGFPPISNHAAVDEANQMGARRSVSVLTLLGLSLSQNVLEDTGDSFNRHHRQPGEIQYFYWVTKGLDFYLLVIFVNKVRILFVVNFQELQLHTPFCAFSAQLFQQSLQNGLIYPIALRCFWLISEKWISLTRIALPVRHDRHIRPIKKFLLNLPLYIGGHLLRRIHLIVNPIELVLLTFLPLLPPFQYYFLVVEFYNWVFIFIFVLTPDS